MGVRLSHVAYTHLVDLFHRRFLQGILLTSVEHLAFGRHTLLFVFVLLMILLQIHQLPLLLSAVPVNFVITMSSLLKDQVKYFRKSLLLPVIDPCRCLLALLVVVYAHICGLLKLRRRRDRFRRSSSRHLQIIPN